MSGKKSGVNAVDELRESARDTREDLTDTVTQLRAKAATNGRRAGGWTAAALGVLAGVAAIVTLRWRKARNTPKSRTERAWREVKTRVRKTAARMS